MYRHTHTINLFLSVFIPNCIFCLFIINKELLYSAIRKDPVVKYLAAEVAYLQLCKWNYQFYAYIDCCLLRFSFWSHNMNNHVFSSENHVGLSKLYFSPCTCDMIQSFTGTCKFFYTDFFPHAVHQKDLFLDEKAAYGKNHVCGPPSSFVSEAGTELKLGRRLKQGTQHSCTSVS